MPSPFPGMDPYLEGSLWTTVHFSLSAEIVRDLASKLRPRYLVLSVEQLATVMPERVPHVTVEIRDATNRQLVTAMHFAEHGASSGDRPIAPGSACPDAAALARHALLRVREPR